MLLEYPGYGRIRRVPYMKRSEINRALQEMEDKLFRLVAIKIFRYCGLWHGRLLLLGKEKSTIVKSCFFLNVQFCHKVSVLR